MANYILKTVKADGSSYDNFMWPLKVGATVIAPDFNNNPVCGGGLHGLYNGIGNGRLLNWRSDAVWIVAKVPKKARVVDLGNKVKVDRCKVVHVGNQETATKFLVDNGCDGAIVGLTATAGYEGTATVGDGGTIILKWWDGSNRRQRIVVGYVGEKGIESNVAYQLDRNGKFVKADKGENNG